MYTLKPLLAALLLSTSALPATAPSSPVALEEFTHDFSWEALFASDNETTTRRLRTDLEADDAEQFLDLLLHLNRHIERTDHVPRFEVVCSEGSAETIQKKVLTLKALLHHAVEKKLVDARALSAFTFYCEPPSNPGPEKEQGYENIHRAAMALAPYISQEPAPPVEAMYEDFALRAQELQKRGVEPRIVEIAIAPVTGFVRHYSDHPEWLKWVELTGYGSFNIGEGVEQLGGAPEALQRVEEVLNGPKKVFLYEAYPATRVAVTSPKGALYVDFNRMGARAEPRVFAPLLSSERSELQAFVVAAKQGWNEPLEQKFKGELLSLQGGEAFVASLTHAIREEGLSFSEKRALEMAERFFDPSQLKSKTQGVIRILTSLWMNKGIQGTISDLAVAELLGHPELIEPSCLHSHQRIHLEVVNGRINTVFVDDPELAHHYAIVSQPEEGVSGVRIDALKGSIAEFYSSL